jgi:hypothetical protein
MSQVGGQAVQVGGQAVVDLRDLEGMVPLDTEVLKFQPWLPPAKAKRSSPTAHGFFVRPPYYSSIAARFSLASSSAACTRSEINDEVLQR